MLCAECAKSKSTLTSWASEYDIPTIELHDRAVYFETLPLALFRHLEEDFTLFFSDVCLLDDGDKPFRIFCTYVGVDAKHCKRILQAGDNVPSMSPVLDLTSRMTVAFDAWLRFGANAHFSRLSTLVLSMPDKHDLPIAQGPQCPSLRILDLRFADGTRSTGSELATLLRAHFASAAFPLESSRVSTPLSSRTPSFPLVRQNSRYSGTTSELQCLLLAHSRLPCCFRCPSPDS